jgi:hypothetical protein
MQAAALRRNRTQLFGHWLLWLAALKAKRRRKIFWASTIIWALGDIRREQHILSTIGNKAKVRRCRLNEQRRRDLNPQPPRPYFLDCQTEISQNAGRSIQLSYAARSVHVLWREKLIAQGKFDDLDTPENI